MKRLLILLFMISILITPVKAMDISAPPAPENAEEYMPSESLSFGKDLWYIIKSTISDIAPEIAEAMSVCAATIAVQLLISVAQNFAGVAKKTVILSGAIALSGILLGPSKALISVGINTIQSITEYNKLLLPTLTAALAAQGGTNTSTALYAGTMVLDTILTSIMSKILLPCLYIYIALSITFSAMQEPTLRKLLDFSKWLLTWMLKILIYTFTGYMSVTGVISGTVDAAAVKATKIAISGTVPIVGNVISDASETVLVSASVVKNTVGAYGALVILAICISPFLKIGIQYILLRLTAGISSVFAEKSTVALVEQISSAMGFLLAMTGTVCLLSLVSIVCFMKGMS